MAGIIKNQILKHLSKFAKNLSANSINVSTLRGEGELFNLELNEKVLTELLELPNWMQISQASVNKVSVKIQWTKLKNTPILLTMDEVFVQMETVSELRPPTVSAELSAYKSNSKYGYVEKVIDGLTVTINSVYMKFKSPSFMTTVQLSKISLCSKSPTWQLADLRMTRLKDFNQQYVLIFKELYWHSLKIEARSSDPQLTPIRLITNQSCCRITVKKKLADCSVIGCRLVLLCEDILWVLTDSQILSAYHLVESLSGLIKKSTEQSQKEKAARKLDSISKYSDNPFAVSSPSAGKTRSEKGGGGLFGSGLTPPQVDQSSLHRFEVFRKFDVVETSYHFSSERIDLHFCDDPGPGRSSYPDLNKGGTLQMSLMKIRMDFYPYHPALGHRNHWIKYQSGTLHQWTKTSLNHFKNNLCEFFSSKKSSHTPLGRASPHLSQRPASSSTVVDGSPAGKSYVKDQLSMLMSTSLLFSCKDAIVYKVASTKRKSRIAEMVTSDDARVNMPEGSPLVLIEMSSYYFPGGVHYPIPPPKVFMQVNPIKLEVDLMSLLWLNAFACHLMERTIKSAKAPPYFDMQLEAIAPRIILKPIVKSEKQRERPRALQIMSSRFIVSNVRSPDPTRPGSKSALFTCLEEAQKGPLFFASEFPSKPGDKQPIPSKFLSHAEGSDLINRPLDESFKEDGYALDTLWLEPRDILFVYTDSLWLEYLEKTSDQPYKSSVFVEPFALSIWVYIRELSLPCASNHHSLSQSRDSLCTNNSLINAASKCSFNRGDSYDLKNEASWHILAFTPQVISVNITHLQFLFLMRILDAFAEFSTFLNEDSVVIQSKLESALIAAIFSDISLSLIYSPTLQMPSDTVPTSPTAMFNGNAHTLSSLRPLKDLICGVESPEEQKLDSVQSPNLNLSSQGINFYSCDETDNVLAKSQSDGCLATAASDPLPNHLEFPEISSISKSGDDLLNTSVHSPRSSSKRSSETLSRKSSSSSISSSVRKGFQSLKITIESSVGSKTVVDDLSETASINSDISNDSDNFVMLNLNSSSENIANIECSFFKADVKNPEVYDEIEAATEALEDTTPSFSEPSEASTATKSEKYVGVNTFRLGCCQIIIEGEGHNSCIKFQSSFVGHEESPRISIDDFRSKCKERNSKNSQNLASNPCSIKACLNTEGVMKVSSSTEKENELPYYLVGRYNCSLPVHRNANLEVDVCGFSLNASVSSLMEIGDLVQEEIDPIPLPMKVKLEDIRLELIDDKSKLKKNSQKFYIPKLLIERDEVCDFTIIPIPTKGFASSSCNSIDFSASTSSYSVQDKSLSREQELQAELTKVQERLASTQRENDNLMKALKILHEDLNTRK